MPVGVAHVVDVARAEAPLVGGHPADVGLLGPHEVGLELDHARRGEQDRGVVLGHQRTPRLVGMSLGDKEIDKRFPQLVRGPPDHGPTSSQPLRVQTMKPPWASSRRGVRAGAGWRSTEGNRSSIWYLVPLRAVNRQAEPGQGPADLPHDGPRGDGEKEPGHAGDLAAPQDEQDDRQGVEAHGPPQHPG